MTSESLRNVLLRIKPEFSLQLIQLDSFECRNFTSKFLRDLVSTENSLLFREIPKNQTTIYRVGYYINPQNILLFGLLSDLPRACDIGVWKPIGDEALRLISRDDSYKQKINSEQPFHDEELFKDQVFCVIMFFDLLVTTAAREGYEYHMWLMYMSAIIKKLENEYAPDPIKIDEDAEFPTLGSRLIYEAYSCLRNWVSLAKNLPADNPHVEPAHLEGSEGGSIPYWAAVDLCDALRTILLSSKLPARFQSDRHEGFVRTLSGIPRNTPLSILRKVLIERVIRGHGIGSEDISSVLEEVNRTIDHVVLSNAKDFTEAVSERSLS